ncbi:CTP synthetase [Candidatus Roizmanbacteria bacterium CG22_combo_CG10-13_8_21_14_all_38_20]|uniref:CTP synthase (glutamine hydrolyzing) n=1 Tax=Candidatus Roizmanbacteria bacterium CG22_combo_CG10-13_8_21_14_all_38_20 TaxID=1974862 RepID=A0A2H0BV09_9BACT|nr:CTP synthase [Candidatus Microgenomates bacterium]PIP61379.1 MAG: CTP synthetase [Candidatus Roizmanbacteria bacterium CG22_combo_CG10-13_8_21_14_all_38_20]PJC31490.1 MAG: CTP synthase [Candidatus Roizmanbacteria bacterium CG_4_9_14_0_2_um_filter_38_17]
MRTKYVFVSGGVISGLGKGIIAASVSLLLESAGYKVTPIKCENYLNVDAGTINPIEHGDPFLCEDGTEADMDIGTYEKFLGKNLGKENFMTLGQVYQSVIERERKFEYEGEDVEAIPHLTDEIQKRWIDAGKKTKADVIVIELGGTAGEYQNLFYYEANRILSLKNPGDVVHIHVGYMPCPPHLGEPKTKPIQLSVRTLNSMGIQPDFIVARAEKSMDKRRKDRFALFCNVHPEDVISAPDADTVYRVPLMLKEQGMDMRLLDKLGLEKKKGDLLEWTKLVNRIGEIKKSGNKVNIGIVGKYFGTGEYQLRDSYAALFDALQHAAWHHGYELNTKWISAQTVEKKGMGTQVKGVDGILVPIGWGERGAEGMIEAAGYAREQKIPYLGLCYGMQLAVVSFARDVVGLKNANTTENVPDAVDPVIHLMPAQKKFMNRRAYGGTMRLGGWDATIKNGTRAYWAYDKYDGFINKKTELTSERHRHRYEFNDKYANAMEKHGLVISARSVVENLAEIVELPKDKHPFYMATQGHPEYKSRPNRPHPIFIEYIEACINNK